MCVATLFLSFLVVELWAAMYGYRPYAAVTTSPYEFNEQEYLRRRRYKQNVRANSPKERLFQMPYFKSVCSTSWKFWGVLLSLLVIIFFVGIALWIAWARSNSEYNWGDEGPLGPELPPAICYKCSNYAHVMEGRQLSSNIDVERSESGGIEVGGALGIAVDVEDQRQVLCQEFVNRTALAETQSPSDDDCGDSLYNGCFKMVTKSYRLISNVGREQLSATIVTRNCAEIPKSISLGCYKTFGGAGMERETCYCKGNYCNSATPEVGSILLSLIFSLFIQLT